MILKKITIWFLVTLRMNKGNSIEVVNRYSSLNDQTKFWENEIYKIKDSFNSEIQDRKIMSKKLSKYIAASDYIDKALIVLSATSGGISIISFATVIGVPAGTESPSFSLAFSLATGITKKLRNNKNKNKKHDKIVMLAKSKLSSIETLISQALTDPEISDEEFQSIVNEKEKYEKVIEASVIKNNGNAYD